MNRQVRTQAADFVPARNLWVVIPAYDEATIIGSAIDAVAAQTDLDFLLVIVDNNSTDETAVVAAEQLASHPQLSGHIVTETRKGTGAAADTGFRYAIDNGADWIARTDADCLVAPDWVAAIRRHSARAHMLGGKTRARLDDVTVSRTDRALIPLTVAAARLYGKVRSSNRSPEFLGGYVMCVGNNLAVATPAYDASGGFPRLAIEELPIPNDRALVNRIRAVTPHVRYAPDMVVYNSTRRLRRYGMRRTLRWYADHTLDTDRFEVDVR